MTLTSVRPHVGLHLNQSQPRPAAALTCNAPAFFQRTMQKDFTPFLEQYRENVDQYMDDWWIATSDNKAGQALHVQAIHNFLNMCEKHSYFLKASKCEIMQPQIMLLGWLVTREGLVLIHQKSQAFLNGQGHSLVSDKCTRHWGSWDINAHSSKDLLALHNQW
jgi:Reverse transcriptase (RNA-dependent DNA polymerase)